MLVPGGFVFEARKAVRGTRNPARWERLLESKLPPHRIDPADRSMPPPLTLLNCTSSCEEGSCGSSTSSGPFSWWKASGGSRSGSSLGGGEEEVAAAARPIFLGIGEVGDKIGDVKESELTCLV